MHSSRLEIIMTRKIYGECMNEWEAYGEFLIENGRQVTLGDETSDSEVAVVVLSVFCRSGCEPSSATMVYELDEEIRGTCQRFDANELEYNENVAGYQIFAIDRELIENFIPA